MELRFGIGTGYQTVNVPDENLMGELHANKIDTELTGAEEVRRALQDPIGTCRLKDIVKPDEKVAIVTSDITRPLPTSVIMPALLEELAAGGIKDENITLVFALGSHRHQTAAEMEHLAGSEVYKRIRCIDSNPDDCVHLGTTDKGTPVDIFSEVANADRRICLGNIEYHYFAGYSGGAKALMPGVSTRAAIQSNHSMMVDPASKAGNLDTNPVRLDIEQAGQIIGIDFIVNVVLDEHKQIIKAVAGDAVKAHRIGCQFLDKIYRKPLAHGADIVIVSQGGAPKDLNLYQTQKALANAQHAVNDGGVIILVGSCKEGLGEKVFEEWMTTSPSPQAMIDRIHHDFQLGGHKAAAIAMVLQKADIYLVSDLDADFVRSIFLTPMDSVQQAYDQAIKKMGPQASVLAMPYGGSTLPSIEKQ